MALKTKAFDSSQFLVSREAQAELFSDALQTGHASYIAAALGVIARARGMTQIAEETGLSRPALYAALREGGNPTLETVMRVAQALGVELRAVPSSDAQGTETRPASRRSTARKSRRQSNRLLAAAG